jgi:hypothetical protein
VIRPLTALLLATLTPQAAPWPLPNLHGARTLLSRLAPSDRATVERLLHPELGPLFQGEPEQSIDKAIASFPTEPLSLAGLRALAVQATGEELCGTTGNCSFWIIDLQRRRILLRAMGVGAYTVDRSASHGTPDIVTSTLESGAGHELIRWRFGAAAYSPQTCATANYADADGHPYKEPQIVPHACSSEGN